VEYKESESEEYEHPILHVPFDELIHPVFDSQGNIRDKTEEKLEFGIYDRKPVTITESANLRKVCRNMKELKEVLNNFVKISDTTTATIQSQSKKIESQSKEISELKECWLAQANKWDEYSKNNEKTVDDLKLEISTIKKENSLIIAKLQKTIDEKDGEIASLKFDINKKDQQIDSLKSENQKLSLHVDDLQKNGSFEENQKLRGKIITLKQDIRFAKEEIVGGDRWQLRQQINLLTDENQRLNTENTNLTTGNTDKSHRITNLINENIRLSANSNVVNQSLNTDPFSNAEPKFDNNKTNVSTKRVVYGAAVGVKTDRWKGFKHTVNWVDDNEINNHNRKLVENNLKACAYFGDNVQITNLLNAHKSIVNGRGEPDALRSCIFGMDDKTALMIAAKEGHTDCVQTLINYNANVNYLDRNNKTALDYAHKFWKKNKSSNVRQPLWENGAVPSSCCEVLPAGKVPVK
jgi:cell division protein FtsB